MKIKATVIIKTDYRGKDKSKEEILTRYETDILKRLGLFLYNSDVKIKVEEDTDA